LCIKLVLPFSEEKKIKLGPIKFVDDAELTNIIIADQNAFADTQSIDTIRYLFVHVITHFRDERIAHVRTRSVRVPTREKTYATIGMHHPNSDQQFIDSIKHDSLSADRT
jgi:hypothetical protein